MFTTAGRLLGANLHVVDVFALVGGVPHFAHHAVDDAHALLVELHERPLERVVKVAQVLADGVVDLQVLHLLLVPLFRRRKLFSLQFRLDFLDILYDLLILAIQFSSLR